MDARETEVDTELIKSRKPRIGVGILAAFLLHQTVAFVCSFISSLIVQYMGWADIHPTTAESCRRIAMWMGAASIFWFWKRPRLKEWRTPWIVVVAFWFLLGGLAGGHIDTAEDSVNQVFGFSMFFACGLILGLTFVVGTIRRVLGEGRRQQETIRSAVGVIAPSLRKQEETAQNTLVRSSGQSESPSGLLRPAVGTTTDDQEKLPRTSLGDEDFRRGI